MQRRVVIALWIAALCLLQGVAEARERPLRILFVGNSYLRDNGGVHRHVAALAHLAGVMPEVDIDGSAIGGSYLYQQDLDGLLAKGPYDLVVLQGHSTATLTEEKRTRFRAAVRRWQQAQAAQGGQVALYMTPAYTPAHPRFDPEMRVLIAQGYGEVAAEIAAPVIPVGPAFEHAKRLFPQLVLHQGDGSHPTVFGTYLGAVTAFMTLFGAPQTPLAYTMDGAVAQAQAEQLQQAAAEAIAAFHGNSCAPSALGGTLLATADPEPDRAAC